MSSVELRNIGKSFPGLGRQAAATSVLKDVSLHADEGEFLVLLGPSGCGKSTLLRLIAGLEGADRGDILIGGSRVNDVPAAKRRLAMVFQNYALFPHLSVEENIAFGLRVRKISRGERRRKVDEAADLLGLDGFLDRKPGQLSGGQRQRVALGRALVSDASLILMDEPLSNLDAKLRAQMRTELRQLQRTLGLTVVYVTHDQVEAMTMADRVVVLWNGGIEQVAAPRELYRNPATTTVAGFIGSPPMNLAPLIQRPGGFAVSLDGPIVVPDADVPGAVQHGSSDLALGLRPEEVVVAAGSGLPATVKTAELLGSDTLVTVELAGGTTIVARCPGAPDFGEGTSVGISWTDSAVRLFDRATGLHLPTHLDGHHDDRRAALGST